MKRLLLLLIPLLLLSGCYETVTYVGEYTRVNIKIERKSNMHSTRMCTYLEINHLDESPRTYTILKFDPSYYTESHTWTRATSLKHGARYKFRFYDGITGEFLKEEYFYISPGAGPPIDVLIRM